MKTIVSLTVMTPAAHFSVCARAKSPGQYLATCEAAPGIATLSDPDFLPIQLHGRSAARTRQRRVIN
jgi:hypothetical protein